MAPVPHRHPQHPQCHRAGRPATTAPSTGKPSSSSSTARTTRPNAQPNGNIHVASFAPGIAGAMSFEEFKELKKRASSSSRSHGRPSGGTISTGDGHSRSRDGAPRASRDSTSSSAASAMSSKQPSLKSKSDSLHGHHRHKNHPRVTNENAAIHANAASKNAPVEAILSFDEFRELRRARRRRASSGRGNAASKSAASSSSGGSKNSSRRSIDGGGGGGALSMEEFRELVIEKGWRSSFESHLREQQQQQLQQQQEQQRKKGRKGGPPTKTSATQDPIVSHSATTAKISNQKKKKKGGIKGINLTKIREVLQGASFPDALGGGAHSARGEADGAVAGGASQGYGKAATKVDRHVTDGAAGKQPSVDESLFPDVWEKKKEKAEVHTKEIKMKTERNTIRMKGDNHDDANDPIGSHIRVPPPGRDRIQRQPHPNCSCDADRVPMAVMSTLTDEDGANSDTGNNGSVTNDSAINASKEQQQQRRQQQQHRPIAKSVKQATKHMVQATTYVASNVVGPKLASAASHAASSAANTVAEATTTALNGANILAKGDVDVVDVMTGAAHGSGSASAAASTDAASSSMANAKTPARSNVTRKLFKHHHQHHDGKGSHNTHHDDPLQSQVSTASQPPQPPQRYADYVTDPDYHVVLTPPPPPAAARNQTLHQPPANHFSTPAHRKYACDPSTPACLIGAVAAGRCHLSEDHPDHPEYIPKDIPRLLIVPEDWEERAGFVATTAGASDRKHNGNGTGPIEIAADGRNKSERYHRASTARTTFDTNDILSTRPLSRSGSNAPVGIAATATTTEGGFPYIVPCPSNPIDVDEVDDEENNSDNAIAEEKHENDDVDDYDDNHDDGKVNSTPTNEVYSDDDARVIKSALRIGREVNRETMLALREGVEMKGRTVVRQNTMQDENFDDDEDDNEVDEENDDPRNHSMWVAVPDMDEEEEDDLDPSDVIIGDLDDGFNDAFESVTPKSEGSGTYFIGEVCVDDHDEDGLIIESAVSGDDSYGNIGDIHIGFSPVGNDIVKECDFVVEDASDDDDNDNDREDDTNKSEKEGEDQEIESQLVEPGVSSHEQRDTKRVLFSKEENDDEITGNQTHPESAHDCEPLSEQLHEHREHQIIVHGSDRSEFENPFALNEEENNAAANVVLSFDDDTVKGSGKRVLKGRVLFVRIGKKISKVKSRGKNVLQQVFVLRPFGKGKNGEVHQDGSGSEGANEMHEDQVVLTIPENPSLPHSPSSVSVASISSSVLTGGTNTKRNLGAVPVYSVPKAENPYGTINYNRSSTESTMNGSDALPPPPEENSFPVVPCSGTNDDDAISLLAAAIAASRDARVVDQENGNEKTLVENTEATEEAKEMEQEDESSVFLVVTPDDGGPTEAFQVVSSIDGITPVRDINEITGEHSEIRPNNLSCIFACNGQGSRGAASIQIMDAAAGGIDLTPTAVNQNFASVFRNGPPASVAPTNGEFSNLLPSPAAESDDEEEETLLHDGCTVIHQASTFGDHTIATTTTAPPQAADDDKEQKFISSDDTYASIREQVINESRAIAARVGSFEFSPEPKPSLCRQAAKNGSFLFSPDNMGRAGPRIRARERLALKQGNVAPSITMLPAADKTTKLEQSTKLAITEKRSYSSEVSSEENEREAMIVMEPAIEIKKSEADSESHNAGGSRSSIEVEVQKKAVMSSVTEPRLFSFKSTLSKFDVYAEGSESITPAVEGDSPVADEEIANAPTVEKVSTPRTDDRSKKTYPTTPFPENMPEKETIDSPKPTVAFPTSVLSPTNSTSSKASSGRKKSPRTKTIPKSALKTKRGLVKERVSDIQQRIEGLSAVTGVNGRLKRNHSYRLRSPRRLTNGEGKLAPRKPVLQNPMFIRSVPIGIAKSYSLDESDHIPHYVEQKNSFDKATIATDIIREKEEEQYDDHTDLYSDEEDTNLHYSSKYLSTSANAVGVTSPSNLESESHSPVQSLLDCDSSSYVSEATEYDAFNALLGKLNDCGSSSSDGSDDSHTVEKTLFGSAQTDKENAEANNVQPLSSDDFLPFKQDGLVRPTEINQHDKRSALATMATRDLQLSPLQRTPMQARKWRTMAAAAAQNKSGSVRFK